MKKIYYNYAEFLLCLRSSLKPLGCITHSNQPCSCVFCHWLCGQGLTEQGPSLVAPRCYHSTNNSNGSNMWTFYVCVKEKENIIFSINWLQRRKNYRYFISWQITWSFVSSSDRDLPFLRNLYFGGWRAWNPESVQQVGDDLWHRG